MAIALNVAALVFAALLMASLIRGQRTSTARRRAEMRPWFLASVICLGLGCLGMALVLISRLM